MVPSLNSLGNNYCKRIQPRVNLDPNFLDVTKHRLLAYLRVYGWVAIFGHLPVGDRLNYGSGEFWVRRAVATKSEREIVSLGRRLSSSELRVNITRELYRS
jgi:hypothetical protein